jgi:hypothetical protein
MDTCVGAAIAGDVALTPATKMALAPRILLITTAPAPKRTNPQRWVVLARLQTKRVVRITSSRAHDAKHGFVHRRIGRRLTSVDLRATDRSHAQVFGVRVMIKTSSAVGSLRLDAVKDVISEGACIADSSANASRVPRSQESA